MIKNIRKKFKKVNSQKGFTLLEILVVLTIMGFLIAMVAPRLAGISGSAVDTVCDSNQNRMVGYMASFYETTHRYPNKLTNLVIVDGTGPGTFQIPPVSNQDPDDGAEVLANELYSRNHFHIHYLDAAEASELVDMGIARLFNLNDYSGMDASDLTAYDNDVDLVAVSTEQPSMAPVSPAAGVGVAMVGCGVHVASGTGAWTAVVNTVERGWGEPDNFGRIVLGMGTECGLITSGVISNAAHCPGGIQNADNVTYNDYILLLPRLEATIAKMQNTTNLLTATAIVDADSATEGIQLNAVAYDDEPDTTGYAFTATTGNAGNLKLRTFTIDEAQEGWQFATMCPEGHMYPADDEEFWGIDIDNGGTI